ncbi:UPF0396 protein [Nymphaea thermarum]|nr:UPF0396 protein [Nymphaea thermarum]
MSRRGDTGNGVRIASAVELPDREHNGGHRRYDPVPSPERGTPASHLSFSDHDRSSSDSDEETSRRPYRRCSRSPSEGDRRETLTRPQKPSVAGDRREVLARGSDENFRNPSLDDCYASPARGSGRRSDSPYLDGRHETLDRHYGRRSPSPNFREREKTLSRRSERLSPSYERYETQAARSGRRSRSPGFSDRFPNHGRSEKDDYWYEQGTDRKENGRGSPTSRKFHRHGDGYRRPSNQTRFLDRGSRSSDSDGEDEDLKGLNFHEYRRLKRQKLRKKLKNCIWRVTPSPPPDWRGRLDSPAQDDKTASAYQDGNCAVDRKDGSLVDGRKMDATVKGKKPEDTKKSASNPADSDGSGESASSYSSSESDRSISPRAAKRKKGQSSRRKSRSSTRKSKKSKYDTESDSDESLSSTDESSDEEQKVRKKKSGSTSSRRQQSKSKRGSRATGSHRRRRKGRDDSSENSESADDSEPSRKQKKTMKEKKLDAGSNTDESLSLTETSGEEVEKKSSGSVRDRLQSKDERSNRISRKKRRNSRGKDSDDTGNEDDCSFDSSDDQSKSKKKKSKSKTSISSSHSNRRRTRHPSDSDAPSKSDRSSDSESGAHEEEEAEPRAAETDSEVLKFKELIESQKKPASALDNEPFVGPAPLPKAEGHISYGGALRPGEGDAIAQYVQQGKRIPRRGEVGLTAEEIQKFESLGYVMSGSRHQRMNAIRIRKENQVYSAEDKRALAMFNYEEKSKREHKVMSDLQRLVQRHIDQESKT